jgi:hypothetical protein
MGLQRDTFIRSEIKNIIPTVWEDVEKYAANNLMTTSVQQHSTVSASFVLLFLQYLPAIDFVAVDNYFYKQVE